MISTISDNGYREEIAAQLLESARVKWLMVTACRGAILEAAEVIADSLRRGGKLLVCGNGGSAADAQHIAAELVGRLAPGRERQPLPALALTTDTSALTAIGNDYGFEQLFARQVQALGRPGDALLGISTSGNSGNVIEAVRCARTLGMRSIALLGGEGGRLRALVDLAIVVPSAATARIQEGHITIGHILCDLVERMLAAESREKGGELSCLSGRTSG